MTDQPIHDDDPDDDDLDPAKLARRVRSSNPWAPPPEPPREGEDDPVALAAKIRRY